MYVLSMYTQTHFTQLVPDSAWFICRRLRVRAWLSQAWQGGPFLPKKHFLGKEIKYIHTVWTINDVIKGNSL